MSLKKRGLKEGNSKLEDSALFGVIDPVIHTNHVENTHARFPVAANCQARKLALSIGLKAEYYKAQALTLLQRTSIR